MKRRPKDGAPVRLDFLDEIVTDRLSLLLSFSAERKLFLNLTAKILKCIIRNYGEVSERFKVTVLKTVVRERTVGSNPTLSAIFLPVEVYQIHAVLCNVN